MTTTLKRDRDGLRRSGAQARRKNLSFYDNPLYARPLAPGGDMAAFYDWHDSASAWAAGWLDEDAGRDQALQRLLKITMW